MSYQVVKKIVDNKRLLERQIGDLLIEFSNKHGVEIESISAEPISSFVKDNSELIMTYNIRLNLNLPE